MPIKVACACGAAFAAKDELAGRTVACPKCKQPLTIPRPQAAAAPAAPAAPHANAGLFDDLGMKARDTTLPRCPSCAAEMAPNAVICIKCGFNSKLGRRMETIKMSGAAGLAEPGAGGGGHGAAVTDMLMARAAQNAEEDAIAEASKTSVGAPLWVWVTALGCVLLFGLVMSLVEQSTALIGTAWVMIVTSAVLTIGSWGAICVRAFLTNPLFGLIVLFTDLIFLTIAIALFWFIDPETVPREVMLFCFMLVGAGSTGYAYTDPEGCAKFMFYSQVAYGLRVVGFVLLIVGWIVAAVSRDSGQTSQLPAPPDTEVIHSTQA